MRSNPLPCGQCGECCKTANEYAVILFPEDVNRLAAGMGITPPELLEAHASIRLVGGVTVYYLKKEAGRGGCRFLEGRLCGVYPHRPSQCRLAPYAFFAEYGNWAHVPCIGGEQAFLARRQDSLASDKALLRTLIDPGYAGMTVNNEQ